MNFDHLENLTNTMMTSVTAAVQAGIKMVSTDAKALCPVDSGALKESIQETVQPSDDAVVGTVTATAPYASAVEMGTVSTPAQPYMQPAFSQNKQAFEENLIKALSSLRY